MSTIEELSALKLSDLKTLAKEKDIDVSGLKKDEIVFKLSKVEEPKVEVQEERKDTPIEVSGVLSILEDGFGFLRVGNYTSSDGDTFVSPTFIKKFRLRQGDYITGKKRQPRDNERYSSLIYIDTINYQTTDMIRSRVSFEDLTPVFPDERVKLERQGDLLPCVLWI